MSWQRFCSVDDYFLYALNVGQYTHRCVDGSSEWVNKQLKNGKTLDELAENATRMRIGRWDREERAKRSIAKDAVKAAKEMKKMEKKIKKEQDSSKASLEDHLGNG